MFDLNLIAQKIEELETGYNSIDLSKEELDLAQIQRNFDDKNNVLNAKKARRAEIMNEIVKLRDALSAINNLVPVEEADEELPEEGLEEEVELNKEELE